METQKMINENIEMVKADANAKVIADMDKAQASFMEARAEKRKAEEISTQPAPPQKPRWKFWQKD
jgi:hypothetical protein